MVKKGQKQLSVTDIVLNAEVDVIQQALEARSKVDTLLTQREEAYRKIHELELQIESVIGEEGVFPYPAPPETVAGFGKLPTATRPKPKKVVEEKELDENDDQDNDSDLEDEEIEDTDVEAIDSDKEDEDANDETSSKPAPKGKK